MPTYETVFAVPITLSEEERAESVKDIESFISEVGGSVTNNEELGEKKMAYKVKGKDRAYYHFMAFNCPADGIDKLKKHYKIHSNYIRNIIVSKNK